MSGVWERLPGTDLVEHTLAPAGLLTPADTAGLGRALALALAAAPTAAPTAIPRSLLAEVLGDADRLLESLG